MMNQNQLSRRQLLSGDVAGRALPYRPPWAVAEEFFDDTCTNCGECIEVCPTKILSFGRGKLPVVDLSQNECTFCGKCADVCEANALKKDSVEAGCKAWDIVVSFDDSCLSIQRVMCRTCSDNCDESAIHFRLEVGGKATPELNLEECTGCGACITPCPANAVHMSRRAAVEKVEEVEVEQKGEIQ